MLLREYLLQSASRLNKSERQTAASVGLTPVAWRNLIHGVADPHLKTLLTIGKNLGFEVVLSRPGESVALKIAPPKTTGTKADVQVVRAQPSAWRQTMDDLVSHLTLEQFEQVSRVLAEMVKAFAPTKKIEHPQKTRIRKRAKLK